MKQEMADQKVTLMNSESNRPQLEVNVKQDAIADLQILVKHESDEIELTETELQLPDIYYALFCVKMEPSDESVELLERIPASPEANEETDEALDHHQPVTNRGNTMVHPQAEVKQCDIGEGYIVMNVNTSYKSFECSICKYKSTHKCGLISHLKSHREKKLRKLYECWACEYKTVHKYIIESHLRIHTGEKPYKCPKCESRFRADDNLRKHMMVHTGEKPYECSMCNFKTSHNNNLKKHLRIHTKEKPFECFVCEYKFARKDSLKAYLRIHTGVKPFECSMCKYKSARKDKLVHHMRIHTRVKPYE